MQCDLNVSLLCRSVDLRRGGPAVVGSSSVSLPRLRSSSLALRGGFCLRRLSSSPPPRGKSRRNKPSPPRAGGAASPPPPASPHPFAPPGLFFWFPPLTNST